MFGLFFLEQTVHCPCGDNNNHNNIDVILCSNLFRRLIQCLYLLHQYCYISQQNSCYYCFKLPHNFCTDNILKNMLIHSISEKKIRRLISILCLMCFIDRWSQDMVSIKTGSPNLTNTRANTSHAYLLLFISFVLSVHK